MELPQPRPIMTEGKKPTHDFLSLYTHSSFPDPKSSQEPSEKLGHWSSERPLQPPFHHSSSFNSLSSSNKKTQKSQSFMEMIKSGRGLQEDEEDDDEEFANSSKKSSSSHKDGKSGDQKANTPRSKHSATEQRRRSKINDRFQILREIIPQNDQKRDKASFLLEVIEYIQYLQEKVNRYDTSYRGWNQEPVKLTPWRNGHAPSESVVDHPQALKSGPNPALMFPGKFDESVIPNPIVLTNTQNQVDSGLSTPFKTIDQSVELVNKSVPIPLQPNMFTHSAPPQQPMSEDENMVSQPQSQSWPVRPHATECPGTSDTSNEHEELTVEGGTISFEGVYSQGLLNNLTHALQSSGVDLSQASISVQVDIGKRAVNRLNAVATGAKDDRNMYGNRVTAQSRVESSGDDSDQARKRHRTE